MSSTGGTTYRFKSQDTVGAADAMDDRKYLEECFVDNGELEVLRDLENPKTIVLGRTGAGKSALVLRLEQSEERAVVIRPEQLAMTYITNSTIIPYLTLLGVDLDLFFKYLWLHVLVVELIKRHYDLGRDGAKISMLDSLIGRLKGRRKARLLDYVTQESASFFLETEERVKQVTNKFETDVKAELAPSLPGGKFSTSAMDKLSSEEKVEMVHRVQKVVNEIKIQQLNGVMDLLEEEIDDPQKRYFLVIDGLDEHWVDDALRYRLIRALIDTVRTFRRIPQAKVVVVIRIDLLDKVYKETANRGFQEEKYTSLYLDVVWSRAQLVEMLNRRVNLLIKEAYTSKPVVVEDLLPYRLEGREAINYMLDRTMMRPRDLILFFNACIKEAAGNPKISLESLKKAEREYSRGRIESLAAEWRDLYPNLRFFLDFFSEFPGRFGWSWITEEHCSSFFERVFAANLPDDEFRRLVEDCVAEKISREEFCRRLLGLMFNVGIVGALLPHDDNLLWSFEGRRNLSESELRHEDLRFEIHPCFWDVLSIRFDS